MKDKGELLLELAEKIRLTRKREIRPASMDTYLRVSSYFMPFEDLTKEKIDQRLLGKSAYTHNLYLKILKILVQLEEIDQSVIETFRLRTEEDKYQSKKQLVSREELKQIIANTDDLQMQTFHSLLFETGARIGEFLAIQRSDVFTIKNNDSAIEYYVFLKGKTGYREIPVIESLCYLLPYLAHRGDHEGQLWKQTPAENDLFYKTAEARLTAVLKKTNIHKNPKISCHTYRHSRATELAAKLSISVLMAFFGWSKPDMAMRYVHLAGADVRNAMNDYYGLHVTEERITLTNCPVCKIPLATHQEKCPQCNYSFIRKFSRDKKETAKIKLRKLLNDPDFATKMIDLLVSGLDEIEGEKEK
ncbi:MAG: site-specific integrase [Candidatus Heimdallarchaeota archaeon]|nr:site-specific integrase [Candidatus Heimdallarchaeota archaeon]